MEVIPTRPDIRRDPTLKDHKGDGPFIPCTGYPKGSEVAQGCMMNRPLGAAPSVMSCLDRVEDALTPCCENCWDSGGKIRGLQGITGNSSILNFCNKKGGLACRRTTCRFPLDWI
jgi:hypothetical protein